ncbi:MAG: short-chain dehydrogenase [Alphaproteobacteria bacterium HGW-Alphaproteobacteria-1]|nr:MAG: short-chain dehydrogenase [Alphaproteobacteria bacterium HGW-Alphaproteobacteria-1]
MTERPVAFITGATRNIGRATAIALAHQGFDIGLNGRADTAAAEATAAEVRAAGAEAHILMGDVLDPAALAGIFARIESGPGRLDVLVNNVGLRRETPFEAMDLDEWRAVVHPQLDALFLATKLALPLLRRSDRGRIVNLGGLSAHIGARDRAHVVTVKAAVLGFTRALARDLAADRITVNTVVPGNIDTTRNGPLPAHMAAATGRKGRPEEVAAAIAMLCAPEGAYTTGQTLHVNGGAYLSS